MLVTLRLPWQPCDGRGSPPRSWRPQFGAAERKGNVHVQYAWTYPGASLPDLLPRLLLCRFGSHMKITTPFLKRSHALLIAAAVINLICRRGIEKQRGHLTRGRRRSHPFYR